MKNVEIDKLLKIKVFIENFWRFFENIENLEENQKNRKNIDFDFLIFGFFEIDRN